MVEYDVARKYMVKLVGAIGARGTGAEEVVCTGTIRIEICCEMIPEKVHYLYLDAGVEFGGVKWRESVPEIHNSGLIKVLS